MTDNGSAHRCHAFRDGLNIPTPYTRKTNGKAERFIQTSLREWAYAPRLSILRPARPRHPPLARRLTSPPTLSLGNPPAARLKKSLATPSGFTCLRSSV